MAKMENQELQVLQAPLVLQEREESKDLRDSTASRVCQDLRAALESQENQVLRVLLERLVLLVPRDQGENEALQEREVRWDLMGCRDLRVVPEHQDQTDKRAVLVLQVASESQELRVLWECQEKGASRVHQDQREIREVWVSLALKAKRGLMGKGVLLDLWDLWGQGDPMERRERLGLQDQQADEDQEE